MDLNPFAAAIARFRLLIAAMKASGVNTLAEAPKDGDRRRGLAAARAASRTPAGFVGQITANSYMKREFGKSLIEQFLAK